MLKIFGTIITDFFRIKKMRTLKIASCWLKRPYLPICRYPWPVAYIQTRHF